MSHSGSLPRPHLAEAHVMSLRMHRTVCFQTLRAAEEELGNLRNDKRRRMLAASTGPEVTQEQRLANWVARLREGMAGLVQAQTKRVDRIVQAHAAQLEALSVRCAQRLEIRGRRIADFEKQLADAGRLDAFDVDTIGLGVN